MARIQVFYCYCYLPIELPLVIDAVRTADISYQIAMDSATTQIFREYDLEFVTIAGNLEE